MPNEGENLSVGKYNWLFFKINTFVNILDLFSLTVYVPCGSGPYGGFWYADCDAGKCDHLRDLLGPNKQQQHLSYSRGREESCFQGST